jgi:hypothetical protein
VNKVEYSLTCSILTNDLQERASHRGGGSGGLGVDQRDVAASARCAVRRLQAVRDRSGGVGRQSDLARPTALCRNLIFGAFAILFASTDAQDLDPTGFRVSSYTVTRGWTRAPADVAVLAATSCTAGNLGRSDRRGCAMMKRSVLSLAVSVLVCSSVRPS